MSESNIILDYAKGFAGLLENIMNPLNENSSFKEKFKNTQRKFLINATNLNYAALIIINKGQLSVKSVPNKPKSNLKKKSIGWDGLVSMDTQTFLAFAMKRISIIKLGLKWIFGPVQIKGIFKLFPMMKLFALLQE